jgi:hypothetical protein
MDFKDVADCLLSAMYTASERMAEELEAEDDCNYSLQNDLRWTNNIIKEMEHVVDCVNYLQDMGRMPEKIEEVM